MCLCRIYLDLETVPVDYRNLRAKVYTLCVCVKKEYIYTHTHYPDPLNVVPCFLPPQGSMYPYSYPRGSMYPFSATLCVKYNFVGGTNLRAGFNLLGFAGNLPIALHAGLEDPDLRHR